MVSLGVAQGPSLSEEQARASGGVWGPDCPHNTANPVHFYSLPRTQLRCPVVFLAPDLVLGRIAGMTVSLLPCWPGLSLAAGTQLGPHSLQGGQSTSGCRVRRCLPKCLLSTSPPGSYSSGPPTHFRCGQVTIRGCRDEEEPACLRRASLNRQGCGSGVLMSTCLYSVTLD